MLNYTATYRNMDKKPYDNIMKINSLNPSVTSSLISKRPVEEVMSMKTYANEDSRTPSTSFTFMSNYIEQNSDKKK